MKAIWSPVGDQIGPETSIGSLVSWRASPPSIGKSQTWAEPLRLDIKAIVLPSGLQRGWLSAPGAVVNRLGSPPETGPARDCCSSCRSRGRARRPRKRPCSVRRDLRVGNGLDGQQVVDCHRTTGGPRGEAASIMSKNAKTSRMVSFLEMKSPWNCSSNAGHRLLQGSMSKSRTKAMPRARSEQSSQKEE